MDIVEWLRGHSPTLRIAMRLDEAADEIERSREALLHIAWGGIQSVDDAEKYARKILEENV